MKEEYYLVYRNIKGQQDSASEAILLGDLPTELLDALEIDIKDANSNDGVGEIILDKKQNLSKNEKDRLDYLILGHLWNCGLGKSNPTLSRLKNYYLECSIGREEADIWEIVTGRRHPSNRYIPHTIEDIQWANNAISSIPKCSDIGCYDNDAMMEYALRLILLYERWLSPTGGHWRFTIREMFSYFRRCLLRTGTDYSDKKILGLLKRLNQKHGELAQLHEQDSNAEENCYELTNIGRIRAAGSMRYSPIVPEAAHTIDNKVLVFAKKNDPEAVVGNTTTEIMIATLHRKKINYNEVVKTLFEQRPETKTFTSSRLLLYLKDFAKKLDIEITITDSRIRQLPVWKSSKVHRQSGKTQYRGDMSDAPDENAEDVNNVDYDC